MILRAVLVSKIVWRSLYSSSTYQSLSTLTKKCWSSTLASQTVIPMISMRQLESSRIIISYVLWSLWVRQSIFSNSCANRLRVNSSWLKTRTIMSKFYKDIWCLSSQMRILKISNTFNPLRSAFRPSNSTERPKRCVIYATSSSTNLLNALIANLMFPSTIMEPNLFQTTISVNFAVYYSCLVLNLRGRVKITTRESRDTLDLTDISKATQMKKKATWSIPLSWKIRLV